MTIQSIRQVNEAASTERDKNFAINQLIGRQGALTEMFVSVKNFGAKGGGVTDDTVAIQKALDAVNAAGGGWLFLPAGTYFISAALAVRTGTKLIGCGDASILTFDDTAPNSDNTAPAIRIDGTSVSDVLLSDFKIESDAVTAAGPAGIINCDGKPTDGLAIRRITIDAPNVGRNAISFNSKAAGQIRNVVIDGCRILGAGRMGIEYIQHDSSSYVGGDIRIINNDITNCGAIVAGTGMGISISGSIERVTIAYNRFRTNSNHLELAGAVLSVDVIGNVFSGGLDPTGAATGTIIWNSGATRASNVTINGNVCETDCAGQVVLTNMDLTEVVGNVFYCSQFSIYGDGIRVSDNIIKAYGPVVVYIENGKRNVIEHNTLDQFNNVSVFVAGRCSGAAAVGNIFRDNLVRWPSSPNFDEVSSAAGNLFFGNIRDTGSAIVKGEDSTYTVAGVPGAAVYGVGHTIYVSNESGGATIAFSDGTNWRRVSDRAIVS